MWETQAILKLSSKESYHRADLFHVFRSIKEDLTETEFRWLLYRLQQEKRLFHIDYDIYMTEQPNKLAIYKPLYSERCLLIQKMLEGKYPLLSFVMFESVLLNEFLNHQIAQNTLYIQVEKDISSYIFDILKQEYPGGVLYNPRKGEFDRYWTRDCIVVLDLISQSPIRDENPHAIVIEKLLVDIIAEKCIAATFSPAELPYIFEIAMDSYQLDRRKMHRYAGRRNKADEMIKYLGEK